MAAGVDAGSIYSEIRIALDKLNKDILQAQIAFDKFGTTNTKQSQTMEKTWKKSFSGMSLAGTVAVAAMTLAFKKAISTFANTEQSLANVRAVTGATAEEFAVLKNAAEEAGRTTRFTAGQSADALYYLGSAGFSATQSVEALNGVLTLAGATGSDLASTAESVAANISAFNLEAKDAERVSNVFAAAIGNSQATMQKLSNSMSYIGPVASAFNQSIEGTVGLLQILYNNGFEASQAGTALRSALSDLANATSPANAKLEALGVTFDEINPQTHSYAEIFGTLQEKVTDASDVMAIFGDRAGPAMIKLIEAGKDKIDEYTTAVTGTNAAAEQYAIQNDTLAGSFDMFKSALEGTTNSIIEQLVPAFRSLLEFATKILNFITSLPGPIKALIGGLGGAAAAVGVLSTAFRLMGLSASAALGPIGLIIGAAISIGSAISTATKPAREMAKALNDITIDTEGTDKNTGKLIKRYRELKSQSELTRKEQIEYYKLIEDLKEAIPGLTEEILNNEEALLREAIAQKESNRAKIQAGLDKITAEQGKYKKQVLETEEALRKELAARGDTGRSLEELRQYLRETNFEYGIALQSVKDFDEYVEWGEKSLSTYDAQIGVLTEQLKEYTKANNAAADSGEDSDGETFIEKQIRVRKEQEKTLAEIEARLAQERKIGLIDEQEETKKLIAANEDLVNALLDVGYTGETNEFGDRAIRKAIDSIREYEERLKESVDTEKTVAENTYTIRDEMRRKELEAIDAYLEEQERKKDEARQTEEEKEKEHAEKIKYIRDQLVSGTLALYQSLVDSLNTVYQHDTQNAINAIQEKIDKELITEEDGQKQIAQLKYKADLNAWQAQNWAIIGNIAQAISTALMSAPWPVNLIPIGFATAQGAIQLATQAKVKPQPPKLETGGIVLPKTGGTNAVLAENGSPELALNLGESGKAFLDEFARRVSVAGGGGQFTLILMRDGRKEAESVVKYINGGMVRLKI